MPHLSGITIYPVKSLDGMSLSEATVLPCGALIHDRRWRLVDAEGAVVNAKKNTRFHGIRATFGIEGIENSKIISLESGNFVTLSIDKNRSGENTSLREETFPLLPNREGPCGWLSEALATNVLLQEHFDSGFPDDRDAPGPTLISYESLQEVARWFGWNLEETRRRFRMNFELTMSKDQHSDDETDSYLSRVFQKQAFWEDFLVSPRYDLVHKTDAQQIDSADCFVDVPVLDPLLFRVGRSHFRAVGGCRRCAVPSRDSMTGSETHQFRDAFEARRRHAVSHYIDTSNWSDFFRLGVNTMLLSEPSRVLTGEVLHVEM